MSVNDLIKTLQAIVPISGNKLIMVRDDNGRLSTYPVIWNGEEHVMISAFSESDTQLHKHPFDERYCPRAFIRWRNLRDEKPEYWKPCLVRYEGTDNMEICTYRHNKLLQRNEWLSYAFGCESSFSENDFDRWAYTSDVNELLEKGIGL
jgi:hypothetical protein